MKKLLLLIPLSIGLNAYSHESHENYILEEVKAEKGYILSIDMYEKDCRDIWNKHIEIFKRNNPDVEDPDVISIGEELTVQNCMEDKVKAQREMEMAAIEEAENTQEEEEVVLIREVIIVEKEPEPLPYFIALSGQASYMNKDSDEYEGSGVKLELGKYFRVDDMESIKASIGFSEMRVRAELDEADNENYTSNLVSLDGSYLYQTSENFHIGPALQLLYNTNNSTLSDEDAVEGEVKGLIGVDISYHMSDSLGLNFKVHNQLESNIRAVGSIGLEVRF